MMEILREKRDEIIHIAHECGAYNVRIYGSQAKGTAREDSDIDMIVDYNDDEEFDFLELVIRLEELLGKEVHLTTEEGINDAIREQVMQEAIPL